MIKYVFFDLDETLIDIKSAQNNAIKQFYYEYKFDNICEIVDFVKTWDDLTEFHYAFYSRKEISYEEQRKRRITDLFAKYNVPMKKDAIAIYDDYLVFFMDCWEAYDDAYDALSSLKNKNYKIGLLSNGDITQQKQKLEKVGLIKFFDYINASSEFNYSKPNPCVFEELFKLHNIKYDEVCYVGDSYKKDILPCRSLGIKAILIDRKNINYEDKDLIKISSLLDIEKYINN